MRLFKVMIIVILSVAMILSGCEKDEVVPIAEKTTNVEQSTEEEFTENQAEQQATEAKDEEINQKQQESTEKSTNPINSNDSTKEVKKDEEKAANEPSKVTTEQRSNTTTSTNKSTTKTDGNEANKAVTTTPKTQTSTDKKTTTREPNETQKETAEEQVTTPPPNQVEPKQTVTISVAGDQQKGTILSSTKVEMKEGNTVLDVTLATLKQKGIPISVRGSGSSAYVEGIDNLYEFDRGPLSGWTVKRNGAKLDRSAGAIQVKNGDSIQWIYTSN